MADPLAVQLTTTIPELWGAARWPWPPGGQAAVNSGTQSWMSLQQGCSILRLSMTGFKLCASTGQQTGGQLAWVDRQEQGPSHPPWEPRQPLQRHGNVAGQWQCATMQKLQQRGQGPEYAVSVTETVSLAQGGKVLELCDCSPPLLLSADLA